MAITEPLTIGVMAVDDQFDITGVYLPKRYHKKFKTHLLLGIKDYSFFIEPSFFDLDWLLLDPVDAPVIYESYVSTHTNQGRRISFSVR